MGNFLKPSHATTKSTPFADSKDEWNPKGDTGKFMKNGLYVLWYAKRHLLSWSSIKQQKKKPVALAIGLFEGINQSVSQSVSQSVENSIKCENFKFHSEGR